MSSAPIPENPLTESRKSSAAERVEIESIICDLGPEADSSIRDSENNLPPSENMKSVSEELSEDMSEKFAIVTDQVQEDSSQIEIASNVTVEDAPSESTEPGSDDESLSKLQEQALDDAVQAQIAAIGNPSVVAKRHASLPSDVNVNVVNLEPKQEPVEQLVVSTSEPQKSADSTEDAKADRNVSRTELVEILQNFVEIVKKGDDFQHTGQLAIDPKSSGQNNGITVKDKTDEVIELRCLLVQAQETIIRLLTDRVEDKAKIATLESQIRLLPDLQSQADRAIAIAMNTDDVKNELVTVKQEIERIKAAKVRTDTDGSTKSIWLRLAEWMMKHESSNNEKL